MDRTGYLGMTWVKEDSLGAEVREVVFPLLKPIIQKVISIQEFPALIYALLSSAMALANHSVTLVGTLMVSLVVLL